MANQWGRDGGGPAGRSGSAAGLVVTGVVALALGLAGGYGTARLVAPEAPAPQPSIPASPPAARDGSLYKLYQETLRQREAATREAGDLRLALVELKSHAANLEAELKALKQAANGTSRPDISAAEALSDSQREKIEKLERQLADSGTALEDAKAALAKATRQKEQALKDAGALKIRLAELQSDSTDLETRNQDLALHARQATDKLQAAEAATRTALAERDKARAALAAIEAEMKALKQAGTPDQVPEKAEPSPSDEPGETTADERTAPRDRQAVTDAIARAPGLKTLDFAARQQLAEKLEQGACVTDALEDIFVRVPVLTLRSLIRDLDSPC